MTRVVFSSRARRDLLEILQFNASRNPRFAIDLNDKLRAASRSLSESPLRGVALFTRKRQIRRLVESGHVILYAADNEIMILRILHGSRDVAAIVADMD